MGRTHIKRFQEFLGAKLAAVCMIALVALSGVLLLQATRADHIRADINQSGRVDIFDLSIMLARWGTTDASADLNGNGTVEILDLSELLGVWQVDTSNHGGQKFTLMPPGSQLPSGQECAQRVRRHGWEYDQGNTERNNTRGVPLTNSYLQYWSRAIESRVDGNFTGTTDEIIQWGACKWGFDEDDVRAQAVSESTWRQYWTGDCGRQHDTQFGFNGCESVGLLQIKGADIPPTHAGTWPYAYTSTAFNVDYTLAVRRLCYEGQETWLGENGSGYAAGDLWGCIGRWFSGDWHDAESQRYVAEVQGHLRNKPWFGWGYPGE